MNSINEVERLLYKREEVAAALGIGITKVKQLISSGELRSIKIGTLRRVTATSLREYVQLRELEEREAQG
jgi:excisionase family DNA binding protein